MSYGIERFILDMNEIGYCPEKITGSDGNQYAIIKDFKVPIGRFQDRIIDLGIPIPSDYPRLVGTSIHIKTNPQLLEYTDSVPGIRNIVVSSLGSEWRYWSFKLEAFSENTAQNLITQINGIFQRI